MLWQVMGDQSYHGTAQVWGHLLVQVISFVSPWYFKILSLSHMKHEGEKYTFFTNNLQRGSTVLQLCDEEYGHRGTLLLIGWLFLCHNHLVYLQCYCLDGVAG